MFEAKNTAKDTMGPTYDLDTECDLNSDFVNDSGIICEEKNFVMEGFVETINSSCWFINSIIGGVSVDMLVDTVWSWCCLVLQLYLRVYFRKQIVF